MSNTRDPRHHRKSADSYSDQIMRERIYHKSLGFKSLFYFCSLPLRFDSYRGCTHGCLYCFSQSLNNREPGFHSAAVPADVSRFENLLYAVCNQGESNGLLKSCLKRRIPIHFGCVSDPFQPEEAKSHVTLRFLQILNKYEYPFVLSTKSDLILEPEYLDLIRYSHASIQLSFSTLNDDLASRIEPLAPPPSIRLQVLKQLSGLGIWTVARFQPFLYPREKLTHGLFEKFADSGVRHVILEHLRIPTNSRKTARAALWCALDMDILDRFKKMGLKHSRVSFELESCIKLDNILYAKQEINRLGMSFGSGDNDFHHFSDHLCCCGLPEKREFQKYYKGHLGLGAFNAVRTGKISFSYINKEWQPKGSLKEYLNSDCRLAGLNNAIDLLKHKIDNPSSSNSPLGFYGIETNNSSNYEFNEALFEKLQKLELP